MSKSSEFRAAQIPFVFGCRALAFYMLKHCQWAKRVLQRYTHVCAPMTCRNCQCLSMCRTCVYCECSNETLALKKWNKKENAHFLIDYYMNLFLLGQTSVLIKVASKIIPWKLSTEAKIQWENSIVWRFYLCAWCQREQFDRCELICNQYESVGQSACHPFLAAGLKMFRMQFVGAQKRVLLVNSKLTVCLNYFS